MFTRLQSVDGVMSVVRSEDEDAKLTIILCVIAQYGGDVDWTCVRDVEDHDQTVRSSSSY